MFCFSFNTSVLNTMVIVLRCRKICGWNTSSIRNNEWKELDKKDRNMLYDGKIILCIYTNMLVACDNYRYFFNLLAWYSIMLENHLGSLNISLPKSRNNLCNSAWRGTLVIRDTLNNYCTDRCAVGHTHCYYIVARYNVCVSVWTIPTSS